MKKKVLVAYLLLIVALFCISNSLREWGVDNLDPCCSEICGRTTSFEDCYPNTISGYIGGIAILLIIVVVFNFIDDLVLSKEDKK